MVGADVKIIVFSENTFLKDSIDSFLALKSSNYDCGISSVFFKKGFSFSDATYAFQSYPNSKTGFIVFIDLTLAKTDFDINVLVEFFQKSSLLFAPIFIVESAEDALSLTKFSWMISPRCNLIASTLKDEINFAGFSFFAQLNSNINSLLSIL